MLTYGSSQVKRIIFYRKSELQMFLLISGGHIGGPKRYTNMASPYKLSSPKVRETFRPIIQKLQCIGHKDLRLGQIVYKLVFKL